MNIYENCPILEDDRYLIRRTEQSDLHGLLKVYSDRNALPFFNSDNCNGDNFYYHTEKRMLEALNFWELSYTNGWFARMTIIDKRCGVIGTTELCYRESKDAFDGMCLMRVDVGSAFETEEVLTDVLGLIVPHTDELLGSRGIVTKAPLYAVERIEALIKNGFTPSKDYLIGGHDGYKYNGYWTKTIKT